MTWPSRRWHRRVYATGKVPASPLPQIGVSSTVTPRDSGKASAPSPRWGEVVLGAMGGAATCGAVLILFVGALRDATIASMLFALFGLAVSCTLGAICAFTVEMLMASTGIRDIAVESRRTPAQDDAPDAIESQPAAGTARDGAAASDA